MTDIDAELDRKVRYIDTYQSHITYPLAREILMKVQCALVEDLPSVIVKSFRNDETNLDLWVLAQKAPPVIDHIYNLLRARLETLNRPV